MPRPRDEEADAARRSLLEEPTLYEAEHAASAFGLLLASPEPLESLAALPPPPDPIRATPAPLAASSDEPDPAQKPNPWDEATRVPPIDGQKTQALPQVRYAAIEHALPLSAVTEVRLLPSAPPVLGRRQRLLYPFVVGTLGGLLGLLIAMGGLRIVKQRREARQREQAEAAPLQQQIMDQAARALLLGQRGHARELLQYYELRWPTPSLRQLLLSLDRMEPGERAPQPR